MSVHSPDDSTLLYEMKSMLKVWRQIENPTPSIDAHLLEEEQQEEKEQKQDE